jgi:hypothetical protein
MLDRLPTELLIKVLRHAAPLDYSPSFHLERRELLRNLCLVSKRISVVAQSMLLEVYRANMDGVVHFRNEPEKANKVKLLVIVNHRLPLDFSAHRALSMDRRRIIECFPNVTGLRLHGLATFQWSWLAGCPRTSRFVYLESRLTV